jgi:predicted MFS family arabinose efflux permease
MGEAIKSLFSIRNYIYMFLSFNFLYGLYCAISGVMAAFTDYYHYTSNEISIVCLMFSIAGILNSFFIGMLLDKYQCYRKALIILCIASTIFLGLSAVGLPSKKVGIAGCIMVFTGASMIPVVTICFSFAAELSYPVPESYSIGLMISSA